MHWVYLSEVTWNWEYAPIIPLVHQSSCCRIYHKLPLQVPAHQMEKISTTEKRPGVPTCRGVLLQPLMPWMVLLHDHMSHKSHDPTVDCFRFYSLILSFFHPFSLSLLFHPTLELGDKSTDFFQVATKEKSKVSRPGGLSNITGLVDQHPVGHTSVASWHGWRCWSFGCGAIPFKWHHASKVDSRQLRWSNGVSLKIHPK